MSDEMKEQKERLLKLVHEAVSRDESLREKFQIGKKFRFIHDRLLLLKSSIEENLHAQEKKAETRKDKIAENETLVYVYLYNVQGLVLKTWLKMLNPSVFYEYSVNRPIYAERGLVEGFIRGRTNKVQHAYLMIAVKKEDIISHGESRQDAVGQPLIKVKEGSLRIERLIAFTHNGIHYTLNDAGQLERKQNG